MDFFTGQEEAHKKQKLLCIFALCICGTALATGLLSWLLSLAARKGALLIAIGLDPLEPYLMDSSEQRNLPNFT